MLALYGNTTSLFGCIAKRFPWAVNLLFQFGFAKREAEVFLLKLFLKCRSFGMTLVASWITFSVVLQLGETIYRTKITEVRRQVVLLPLLTLLDKVPAAAIHSQIHY